MHRAKSYELLRWICVVPASIIGGIAAQYVFSIVGRFAFHVSGAGPESNIAFSIHLLALASAAASFVLAGAFTAPRNRLMTSVVLAIAGTLLSVVKHVLGQHHPGLVNYVHLAVETGGAVLAVVLVFCVDKKVAT